jgi:surface antigen
MMAGMRANLLTLSRASHFLLALALSACGASRPAPVAGANPYGGGRVPGLTCAPFARELSGIAIYGEAASWWEDAAGQYRRSNRPAVGSVLVFRREPRLPEGHVSVVSRVLTPRQVLVIQANWVPDELDQDQLVVDVSARNDWTEVRVWYPPIGQMGAHTYPTYGFVLPPRPATHAELVRAAQPAAYYAISARGRQLPRARTYGG